MIDLKIKLDERDAAAVDKVMTRLAQAARRPEGGLKNVGEALLEVTREQFASQTAPDGSKWAPLTPLTVRLRGASGPILTRSGRLKNSVNYSVGGSKLTFGLNTIDAAVHQYGATIKPKKARMLRLAGGGGVVVFARQVTIPARWGARAETAAREAVEEWLEAEAGVS